MASARRARPFGIEAQHPDTFVAHLIGLDQEAACAAIRRMQSITRPANDGGGYLDSLDKKGLARSAGLLRAFLDRIYISSAGRRNGDPAAAAKRAERGSIRAIGSFFHRSYSRCVGPPSLANQHGR